MGRQKFKTRKEIGIKDEKMENISEKEKERKQNMKNKM